MAKYALWAASPHEFGPGKVHVHHLTYAHVFNEPCFELRAVCHGCHDVITEIDRRKAELS